LTHLEFRSDKFPPVEGEDKLVNPGVWGKRLADFLCEGLRREGIETGEPIAEDWGWVLPLVEDPFGVWVGCSNDGEYPDGFRCFLHPHKMSFRRLFSGRASCEVGFRNCGRQLIKCSVRIRVFTRSIGSRWTNWNSKPSRADDPD
jgi:hypothetical protein